MLKHLFYRTVTFVAELPRSRFTYRVADRAHQYLYDRSMQLSLPWLCDYCAISLNKGDHEMCRHELNQLNVEKYPLTFGYQDDLPLVDDATADALDDIDSLELDEPDNWLGAVNDDAHYFDDDDDDEDPLAGDVDPTGGYYDPQPSPVNTQHYFALKERGYL